MEEVLATRRSTASALVVLKPSARVSRRLSRISWSRSLSVMIPPPTRPTPPPPPNLYAMLSATPPHTHTKDQASPPSIAERRVPELIPVLGSQPAGDVSHKPDGRLSLLSVRPAVTPAILNRAATSFAAW